MKAHSEKYPYKSSGSNCLEMCKFKDVAIGSLKCKTCESCQGFSTVHSWIKCKRMKNEQDTLSHK
jgi:hypothetical protein